MSEIHSYGKVWAFGHREASQVIGLRCRVEEKIDGSQFSAKRVGSQVFFRSKGVMLIDGAIPDLFGPTVEHFRSVAHMMRDGAVYRCEAMKAPRHNTLTYARVPNGHAVLFDVDSGREQYATADEIAEEAARLGIEAVPQLDDCIIVSPDDLARHLQRTSFLGGALVEGVVVKPHANVYTPDGKRIAAKLVSEAFKETHSKEWVPEKAAKTEIERRIADEIGTPARFAKAVQRLRERGESTGTVKDIGALIGEVAKDLDEECESYIKDALYAEYRKTIMRLVTSRVPEWYKRQLLSDAFDGDR